MEAHDVDIDMRESRFGFFTFEPQAEPFALEREIERVLSYAKSRATRVDALVLPELAVSDKEYERLWDVARSHDVPMLLAGVRTGRKNFAQLALGQPKAEGRLFRQGKHHRWCLDENQIRDYGLDLNPYKRWWEHIDVEERCLNILTVSGWLSVAHLICEDLARIEPVSDVVRAVGPNLVIALLLDGPQAPARWSGRYATVLADDPGSSVLTVTSLGMALLHNAAGHGPSPTIALWRDAIDGVRPIELPPGSCAALLQLWCDVREEFTADGRSDGGVSGVVRLGKIEWLPKPTYSAG
ncbi:MAG: hypothetical protein M5U28_21105 [Sandaracinaceae bacterium]|nr:hypothetical protein [Sandaracinaceae bacterium]